MRSMEKALCAAAIGAIGYYTVQQLIRQNRWFEFADKVVLVTGGSRGLGLVIARQLVEQGARVAICARTEADVRAAEAQLREQGGEALAPMGR